MTNTLKTETVNFWLCYDHDYAASLTSIPFDSDPREVAGRGRICDVCGDALPYSTHPLTVWVESADRLARVLGIIR